jgi:hypothetical protein
MFFRIVFTFIVAISLISCSGGKKEYYGEVIPRDTFVVVLAEMQIADAMQAMYALNQQGTNISQGLVYQDIFRRHKCDREGFDKTMEYFTRNKEEFEGVYKSVTEYLENMQMKTGIADSLNVQLN